MLEQLYYDKADEIIQHYGRKPASLIPIMQDIQEEFRYLPGELLTYVAAEIGITKAKAYDYTLPFFDLCRFPEPVGGSCQHRTD